MLAVQRRQVFGKTGTVTHFYVNGITGGRLADVRGKRPRSHGTPSQPGEAGTDAELMVFG
jgi:hypothetical protein